MTPTRIIPASAFLFCIVASNYLTTHYGLVPVGFGLVATAGTYTAGAAFVARDWVQDEAGRRTTVALIVAGALLSYLVSDPFIALASGVAFLVSETVDMAIYTPLRRRGYIRAATASNLGGGLVDTLLFLTIAGFPVTGPIVAGQLVGKTWVTVATVAVVVIARAVLRKSVDPKSA